MKMRHALVSLLICVAPFVAVSAEQTAASEGAAINDASTVPNTVTDAKTSRGQQHWGNPPVADTSISSKDKAKTKGSNASTAHNDSAQADSAGGNRSAISHTQGAAMRRGGNIVVPQSRNAQITQESANRLRSLLGTQAREYHARQPNGSVGANRVATRSSAIVDRPRNAGVARVSATTVPNLGMTTTKTRVNAPIIAGTAVGRTLRNATLGGTQLTHKFKS